MGDKHGEKQGAPIHGRSGGGDSGGGAYPNPHKGEEGEADADGFLGHGGQSKMAYHGHGRLGGKDVGGNANAPAEETELDPE
ncbi:MAG: hypothetical protein QOH04_2257 [Sphingomonadales bacterium]|jgi:hypothetical protein|nr:hypothetical protein [Sphingomonadales bacterium]